MFKMRVVLMVAVAMVATLAFSVRAQEGTTRGFSCLSDAPLILTQCGAELEYTQGIIYLNQTEEATPEEIAGIADELMKNNLPTEGCCAVAQNFNAAQCLCQPSLVGLLTGLGIQTAPINSILKVVEQTCGNFEIAECSN
jgi:hypothetical protein